MSSTLVGWCASVAVWRMLCRVGAEGSLDPGPLSSRLVTGDWLACPLKEVARVTLNCHLPVPNSDHHFISRSWACFSVVAARQQWAE